VENTAVELLYDQELEESTLDEEFLTDLATVDVTDEKYILQ
jgi:hypothetical protein